MDSAMAKSRLVEIQEVAAECGVSIALHPSRAGGAPLLFTGEYSNLWRFSHSLVRTVATSCGFEGMEHLSDVLANPPVANESLVGFVWYWSDFCLDSLA